MANYRRNPNPEPRVIEVRFTGACVHCGELIARGEQAMYYPAGSRAGNQRARLAHTSPTKCQQTLRAKLAALDSQPADPAANGYAGDGLDARWEDHYRDMTGA